MLLSRRLEEANWTSSLAGALQVAQRLLLGEHEGVGEVVLAAAFLDVAVLPAQRTVILRVIMVLKSLFLFTAVTRSLCLCIHTRLLSA